jgi:hypothetical protein
VINLAKKIKNNNLTKPISEESTSNKKTSNKKTISRKVKIKQPKKTTLKKVKIKQPKKTTSRKVKTKQPKKTISKANKFELKKVYGDECFFMINGSVLSDLTELCEAFDFMSQDVFNYHVNEDKNDFENWVRDIFNEKELSNQLKKQKTPEKCHIVMLKFFLKNK